MKYFVTTSSTLAHQGSSTSEGLQALCAHRSHGLGLGRGSLSDGGINGRQRTRGMKRHWRLDVGRLQLPAAGESRKPRGHDTRHACAAGVRVSHWWLAVDSNSKVWQLVCKERQRLMWRREEGRGKRGGRAQRDKEGDEADEAGKAPASEGKSRRGSRLSPRCYRLDREEVSGHHSKSPPALPRKSLVPMVPSKSYLGLWGESHDATARGQQARISAIYSFLPSLHPSIPLGCSCITRRQRFLGPRRNAPLAALPVLGSSSAPPTSLNIVTVNNDSGFVACSLSRLAVFLPTSAPRTATSAPCPRLSQTLSRPTLLISYAEYYALSQLVRRPASLPCPAVTRQDEVRGRVRRGRLAMQSRTASPALRALMIRASLRSSPPS